MRPVYIKKEIILRRLDPHEYSVSHHIVRPRRD